MDNHNYGSTLKPDRRLRQSLGVKAERLNEKINFNPSTAKPGDTLTIRIPKLASCSLYEPGSIWLTFDLVLSADTSVVNNVAKNLIKRIKTTIGGKQLRDINEYYLYETFLDLWLPEYERSNMVLQGITKSKEMRNSRSSTLPPTTDPEELKVCAIFGKRYGIQLNPELFAEHGPLYTYALDEEVIEEIELNESKNVVVGPAAGYYHLENIALEYVKIKHDGLGETTMINYDRGHSVLYKVVTSTPVAIIQETDTIIKQGITFGRKSMIGILFLFEDANFKPGERDSEKFLNPNIISVRIAFDGNNNQIYNHGLTSINMYDETKRYFTTERNESGKKDENVYNSIFKYYNDKYCLWIDTRSTKDNKLHGSGMKTENRNDGFQIEITKKPTAPIMKMYTYVIADALCTIKNNSVQSITY